MKVNVLEKDKNSLKIEVIGESVGFVNAIREELWEDKNVTESAYIKEHPYLDEPKIWVRMKKGNPKKALVDASQRLIDKTKELEKEFERALKK